MQIDPELQKRYNGVLLLILGLIIVFIPLHIVYILIGITLLIFGLPNLLASMTQLNDKNPFIITAFIKSLLQVVLGILVIINTNIINYICIVAGFVTLIGTLVEKITNKEGLKYNSKDIILSIFGLVLIMFGGLSFVQTVINIFKIVVGVLIALYGLILVISAHPKHVDIQETLDDYERRYQEKIRRENEQNDDIIDVTYEENKEE